MGRDQRRQIGVNWAGAFGVWMLELIMVLSATLRKYADLAVVRALLVINAVLSFAQEQTTRDELSGSRSDASQAIEVHPQTALKAKRWRIGVAGEV